MKKFEGWRTSELQYIASVIAGRDMERPQGAGNPTTLYEELIREIRNRRVKEELFHFH